VIVPVSAVETVEALIDVVTRTIIKGGLLGFRRPNFTIEARPLHYILLSSQPIKKKRIFQIEDASTVVPLRDASKIDEGDLTVCGVSMAITSIDPTTGKLIKLFSPLSRAELDHKLEIASGAFGAYRHTSIAERARMMRRAGEILDNEKESFGRLMTSEMGKTLRSAIEESVKCAWACRYFAETAERWLADEVVETGVGRCFVHYQPIGPVLAVMPWNFPFWQVFRFAAPALMAGNVGVLKHASNVPQCAMAIEDIFRRAGFQEGVFATLLVGTDQVQQVIEDPRIVAVTLTGSEGAGREVASQAGKQIKKAVLELGGSDPFIVMPSADLDVTIKTAVKARTINNGESCIAAKRFIVADAVYDEFEARFVEGMAALKVGDPMDDATEIGPLATEKLVQDLDAQVQRLVKDGACLLTGGTRVESPGNYYTPTVLTNIDRNTPTYREELFGPVAMLFRAGDITEAIHIANDTPFGLASSAWTNDPAEQKRFIDEIEAGVVFINKMVASDPRLPFGGVKRSGYGRELSAHGIREFTNIKTVCINEIGVDSSRIAAD
jgi:succinate-semialdehyde dehydrogenase/glutarate-semialdehyde dehydrogenase